VVQVPVPVPHVVVVIQRLAHGQRGHGRTDDLLGHSIHLLSFGFGWSMSATPALRASERQDETRRRQSGTDLRSPVRRVHRYAILREEYAHDVLDQLHGERRRRTRMWAGAEWHEGARALGRGPALRAKRGGRIPIARIAMHQIRAHDDVITWC